MYHIALIFILSFFPLDKVKTLDGNEVSLDSLLKEKPVYISFWALWCKGCIKELNQIKELADSGKIYVIAINEDGSRKLNRVKNFLKSRGWNFIHVIDKSQELMRKFRVIALPSSFLYSKSGLEHKFTGFSQKDYKQLLLKIKELEMYYGKHNGSPEHN